MPNLASSWFSRRGGGPVAEVPGPLVFGAVGDQFDVIADFPVPDLERGPVPVFVNLALGEEDVVGEVDHAFGGGDVYADAMETVDGVLGGHAVPSESFTLVVGVSNEYVLDAAGVAEGEPSLVKYLHVFRLDVAFGQAPVPEVQGRGGAGPRGPGSCRAFR